MFRVQTATSDYWQTKDGRYIPYESKQIQASFFTHVGVDYFGPFIIRQRQTKVKRYGVVFTCLAIRAVHVEISISLNTSSFIIALRRFNARRGQVKQILSDNGFNLVRENKELQNHIKERNEKQIHVFFLQKKIECTSTHY